MTVPVTLFLRGDVMTGRGIDQTMLHPGAMLFLESCVSSAVTCVELAERASGHNGNRTGCRDPDAAVGQARRRPGQVAIVTVPGRRLL